MPLCNDDRHTIDQPMINSVFVSPIELLDPRRVLELQERLLDQIGRARITLLVCGTHLDDDGADAAEEVPPERDEQLGWALFELVQSADRHARLQGTLLAITGQPRSIDEAYWQHRLTNTVFTRSPQTAAAGRVIRPTAGFPPAQSSVFRPSSGPRVASEAHALTVS